jgi:predicted metal-dependent phosphoesterase TrpH
MPSRQPFTDLCRQTARGARAGRVDLHLHTIHSDGQYTPAQVVELGRRCGLSALALTDHDTLGGVTAARVAAGSALEVVSGVEITAEHRGREVHLLGYFVRLDFAPLQDALAAVRRRRVERFQAMVERLRASGVSLDEEALGTATPDALGRRHLAEALVRAGQAGSLRDAFQRWLRDGGRAAVPKWRLPVAEAIALVRGAGGVAAVAHPSYHCDEGALAELSRWGLGAVEAEYPDFRPGRTRELRGWADTLDLAITGGSDCHGPGRRGVGATTISATDLERLRQKIPG